MCRIFYPISKHEGERVSGSRISGCGTQANNRRTWALSYRSVRQGFRKEVGASYLFLKQVSLSVFQPRQICSPIPIAGFLPSDSLATALPFMLLRVNSSLDLRNFSPLFNRIESP